MFDTDRSMTGQDGYEYASREEASRGETFPAALAVRLFESDPRIDHVYLLSNVVVARRSGGWDGDALESAAEVIRTFFVFYEQNKAEEAPHAEGEGRRDQADQEEGSEGGEQEG